MVCCQVGTKLITCLLIHGVVARSSGSFANAGTNIHTVPWTAAYGCLVDGIMLAGAGRLGASEGRDSSGAVIHASRGYYK